MQNYIKIAADSIEQLRKCDVFRVLDTYDFDQELIAYIIENRPDLKEEVEQVCMEEWSKDLGYLDSTLDGAM